MSDLKRTWWKENAVYQIYVRSFYDTNGDGVGDLNGVLQKIPYLKELGIKIVWLNPVYKTPDVDNGYDVSDYQDINEKFGTMKEFDVLLEEFHKNGIKVIMDLVVNHSSNQHPWFIESCKGNTGKKDWYIWTKTPNNWRSFFSGSVWKYDENRKEYYLHLFCEEQPDLNWENSDVRRAIYDMMHWWFKKGIDGFRMDVINCISKVPGYPNSEPVGLDGLAPASKYYANGPKVHDYIQEMNKEVLSKYDCMTVGEASDVDVVHAQRFTNPDNHELNMVFFFEHVCVGQPNNDKWKSRQWKLTELKEVFEMWQQRLHGVGWNSLFLSNHDQPRQVSRFGDDTKYRTKSAQMLGTMLHTLEGTPYIYQGEELGMTNVDFGCLEDYRDVEMFNKWEELKKTKEMDYDQFLKIVAYIGRDNSRTPMQWDDSQNGGFTTGNPWMKLNPNYTSINAKNEMSDPNSVFNYYKKLLKLRTEHLIMSYGEVKIILKESEEIFAYTKQLDDVMWLIILNFKGDNVEFTLPTDVKVTQQKILISNYEVDEKEDVKHFTLKPYEARVYHI